MRSSARYWLLRAASIVGLATAAACSAGSSVAPTGVPAAESAMLPGTQPVVSAKHKKRGVAKIVVRIPRKKKSGRRMHPEYISPSTQSMSLNASGQPNQIFNLTPSSAGCSTSESTGYLTCTETAFFPSGQQTIQIYLYDQQNGTGNQLSAATTSVNIAEGGTTTIPITLDGIPSTAKVLLNGSATASVPVGTPTSIPVTVDAYDADNNLIVLPGNYSTPITLMDSDTSGATSLSSSSVTTPGTSLTLSYTGATLSSASISANVNGNDQPNGKATLTVTAAGPTIAEYSIPTSTATAKGIVLGPDGAMWFTEYSGNKIGRITSDGTITEYSGLTGQGPSGIVVGPDGALWFTEYIATGSGPPPIRHAYIGRITTAGSITEYSTPSADAEPNGIVVGPDGNLWFAETFRRQIGQITTGGTITEFSIPSDGTPFGITNGPDGALWFTESEANGENSTGEIGRITTSGSVTEYTSPIVPTASNDDITLGPDGSLWFAGSCFEGGPAIGSITTAGTIAGAYPLPTSASNEGVPVISGITTGPDGALWFTATSGGNDAIASNIGRITTAGTITMNAIPTLGSDPYAIARGPGGLWFTDTGTPNAIGILSISGSAARHRHTPVAPAMHLQPRGLAAQER
jgi:virginiamycin B lyase